MLPLMQEIFGFALLVVSFFFWFGRLADQRMNLDRSLFLVMLLHGEFSWAMDDSWMGRIRGEGKRNGLSRLDANT